MNTGLNKTHWHSLLLSMDFSTSKKVEIGFLSTQCWEYYSHPIKKFNIELKISKIYRPDYHRKGNKCFNVLIQYS